MTYRATPSAWIQPLDCGGFLAAFVDANAPTQDAPTTKWCPSSDNAKRWIEAQAAAFGLPIEWVDKTTERGRGECPSPPAGADVRRAARLRSMLGGRAVKHVEHLPGWPAPASGVYRLVNIFGNNMSTHAYVVRGAILPAAPNGFGWRLERETDETR
jgi:hypothetical protein